MKAFHRTYVITHHTLWYRLVRWSVGLLNCFLTTTKPPPEFVFNRAETTSFRRSRTECFGADPSAIAVFTYAQMNRAKGGNAPGSRKVKVFSFLLCFVQNYVFIFFFFMLCFCLACVLFCVVLWIMTIHLCTFCVVKWHFALFCFVFALPHFIVFRELWKAMFFRVLFVYKVNWFVFLQSSSSTMKYHCSKILPHITVH